MASNRKGVTLKVDSLFFDNIFEKERKKMEVKLQAVSGIDKRLTQLDFTRIVRSNGGGLNVGKFKFERKKARFKTKKG